MENNRIYWIVINIVLSFAVVGFLSYLLAFAVCGVVLEMERAFIWSLTGPAVFVPLSIICNVEDYLKDGKRNK